jgi:DNA-directed RNA polymerase specialized sigma24 family protein
VATHERALRGFLRKSGFGDADDIAQEAFVAAWSSLGRLREDDGFRAWLFGIAWRKALDHAAPPAGPASRRGLEREEAEEAPNQVRSGRPHGAAGRAGRPAAKTSGPA